MITVSALGARLQNGFRDARAFALVANATRSSHLAWRSTVVRRVSRQQLDGWATEQRTRLWEYPWLIEQVAGHVSVEPAVAVDYGAGRSPMPYLLQAVCPSVVVVDPGTAGGPGEWATTDYSQSGVRTIQAGMEERHFEEASITHAVSVSVIEHLPAAARRQALQEIARALAPGGVLGLTVDLAADGYSLWNLAMGEEVDATGHGSLGDLIAEAATVGMSLRRLDMCPITDPRVRVAGLLFDR